MISLQTNVNSLNALNNLNTDNMAQGKTIQQLSSGYRINRSGDDAAGLAVANGYQNTITQLTEGVNNANDGIAQLQIIDGGLSNISNILNRMQTLATQSASGTFTGNRATLNQEYQNLISEITRQASNINLNAGGSFNTNLNVFIGGASSLSNAAVTVNLSGSNSAVDATSLGLSNTNILAGGIGFSSNTQALNTPNALFLAGGKSQAFTFKLYSNGAATSVTATVTDNSTGGTGLTADQALDSLNSQISQYGVTASVDNNGKLQFSGATAFTVSAAAASGGTGLTSGAMSAVANTSNYNLDLTSAHVTAFDTAAAADTLTFQTANGTATVSLAGTETQGQIIAAINSKTAGLGVYAVDDGSSGVSLQSTSTFSVTDANGGASGLFGSANNSANTPSTGGVGTNADAAISAIATAIQNLGLVQGRVGAGENQLQYAVGLAQSQITNFSTAEGDIKDADVATQAANLTKGQVLEQTAIAALAQANSMPQAVLKLLQ
jgi:flagellin